MSGDTSRRLCRAVDRRADELVALARAIHARPETAFEERWASATVARLLAGAGLEVELGAYGLPTAFEAVAGPADGPRVVVCCEYDALPGLGHACGHNLIAAAGAGAGLALAPLARHLGARLSVVGTPAEESGGGKVLLARRGAFDGAAAVLLVHPSDGDVVTPQLRAALSVDVCFRGRAAHAALAPELGRNALDAAVLAYNGVALLRARLGPDEQVSGVIGTTSPPNVVPARAWGRFMVRAADLGRARRIAADVTAAARAGAGGAGCQAVVTEGRTAAYDGLRPDLDLARCFAGHARRLGRPMRWGRPAELARAGSTDLGNVSRRAPSLHPMLAVAPPGVRPHSAAFVRHAVGPRADLAVVDGAKALALTAADVWRHHLSPEGDEP